MKEDLRYLFGLLGDFLSIGIAVAGSVAAGMFMGWLIDEKLFNGRTHPWFLVIFTIFGIAGGIKNIFYMSKRSLRKEEKLEKELRQENDSAGN
jgi:F0F1-type ATP synthase assembly protein I